MFFVPYIATFCLNKFSPFLHILYKDQIKLIDIIDDNSMKFKKKV